jgi:CRP-like cAMP-binding protein
MGCWWCCCCRSTNLDVPVKKEKKIKAVRVKSRSRKGRSGNGGDDDEGFNSSSDEEEDAVDIHSVTGASDTNGFEYPCLVRWICCLCCYLCCRSSTPSNQGKKKGKQRRIGGKVHAEFDPDDYGIPAEFMVKTKNMGKNMTAERRTQLTENLQKVTLLSSLPKPQLDAVIDEMRPTCYPAGATILRRGDVGHHCFIIEDGDVLITDIKGAPPDLEVTIGPESFLGERALLSGDVRSATVTAKTEVSLLMLTREAFDITLGPLKPVIEQVTADKHQTLAFYKEMEDMKKRVLGSREGYRKDRLLADYGEPLDVCRKFQARAEAGELNSNATAASGDNSASSEVMMFK